MATDKSEPKMGIIFRIAILLIITVLGTRWALMSYFDDMARGEFHRKMGEAASPGLVSLRASERERLMSGSLPISAAMQHMATQGRANVSPDIAASASHDTAPVAGWSKMTNEVPAAMTAPPPPPPADSAAASPDAGAKLPVDAGAPARKGHGKRPQ
jgi:hypothetical protein